MTTAGQDCRIDFRGAREFRNEAIENGASFLLVVPVDICFGTEVLNRDLDGGIDFIDYIIVKLVG